MIGINLSGAEFGTGNVYGRDYIYPGLADLNFYTQRGIELVRLPVKWERLQPTIDGALDPAELGRLKTFLADAASSGAQVIVDLHNYGRYGGNVLGSDGAPIAAFARFWVSLAGEIGTSPALLGYDLINEPHHMGSPGVWPAAAQAAINAIRAVDMRTAIYVEGDNFATAEYWIRSNKSLLLTDPADNLIYQAHLYFDRHGAGTYTESYDDQGANPLIGIQRLQAFAKWLEANNARGFIGEVGVPGNDPRWLTVLDNFLGAAEAYDIDVAVWGAGPRWGNYPLALRDAAGGARPQLAVIEKYLGDPQATSLSGDGAANMLVGGRGGDAINGGDGDDVLRGRGGADRIDGGAGSDTATYRSSPRAVDIDLERVLQRGGDAEGDTLTGIEAIRGSGFADLLRGDAHANALFGHAGADLFEGRGGGDLIDGGWGRDTVTYAAPVVIDLGLAVQANGDRLVAIENVTGSNGADRLTGDARANVLSGGDGDDRLEGRGGKDVLDGGAGTDTVSYAGAAGGVTIALQTGRGGGSDAVGDTLVNIENALGSRFDDAIKGSAGINLLDGGAGNDRLTGLGGADRLTGGAGSDRFAYAGLADSTLAAFDTITDFTRGIDRIELTGLDANAARGGNQKFVFIGEAAFSAPGQLRFEIDAAGTHVFGNVDGNFGADFAILLPGAGPLAASDFVL